MTRDILILGNSVAVRVRPPVEPEHTYGDVLREQFGFRVDNQAQPASMISDVDPTTLPTQASNYSAIVIQFGINEASTRSVSRKMYRSLQCPIEEHRLIVRPFSLLARKFETEFRSTLVKIRGERTWMSTAEFKSGYTTLLSSIPMGIPIICLGINTPSDRIESHLPGTQRNVPVYNDVIRIVCNEHGATYLDPASVVAPGMTPDGIHFNSEGHVLIARAIHKLLEATTT